MHFSTALVLVVSLASSTGVTVAAPQSASQAMNSMSLGLATAALSADEASRIAAGSTGNLNVGKYDANVACSRSPARVDTTGPEHTTRDALSNCKATYGGSTYLDTWDGLSCNGTNRFFFKGTKMGYKSAGDCFRVCSGCIDDAIGGNSSDVQCDFHSPDGVLAQCWMGYRLN